MSLGRQQGGANGRTASNQVVDDFLEPKIFGNVETGSKVLREA
jgi:hypothetical protein